MKKSLSLSIAALTLVITMAICPLASQATEPGEVSAAVKVGTLGLGVDLDIGINDYLHARVGLGAMRWSYGVTIDEMKYDFAMGLYTLGLFMDWHPGGSGFRLTGGVIINSHDINARTTPKPDKLYTIGEQSYLGATLGEMQADANFNQFAPYIGFGYGADFDQAGHWSFHLDVGVMWWGSPAVGLSAANAALVPGLQEQLDIEAKKIEDDLSMLQFYPVFSVGVAYRF